MRKEKVKNATKLDVMTIKEEVKVEPTSPPSHHQQHPGPTIDDTSSFGGSYHLQDLSASSGERPNSRLLFDGEKTPPATSRGLLDGFDDLTNGNASSNNNNNNDSKLAGFEIGNSDSSSLLMWCAGCGGKIEERYFLHAADRHWHCSCLKCYVCGVTLEGYLTCFFRQGRVYCRDDYHRAFSVECSGCNNKIGPNELVMKAKHLVFHIKCFMCRICHRLLTKGDHYGIEDDVVLCKAHLTLPNSLRNSSNIGSHPHLIGSAGILDTSSAKSSSPQPNLLAPHQQPNQLQQPLHHQHLVGCETFHSSGTGLFPNDGPGGLPELDIPLMNHHQQHQGSVMGLVPAMGDHQSSVLGHQPHLQHHQEQLLQQFQPGLMSGQAPSVAPVRQQTTGKGRPKKRSKQQQRMELLEVQNNMDMLGGPMDGLMYDPSNGMMMTGSNCGLDGQGQMNGSASQRAKRMRTSFKHHQLRTMKSYFAINQNPDAKDLRQLAQKTNLSKRVLQVWFQNARAKWRRSMQRQQEQNGQDPLRSSAASGLTGDVIVGADSGGCTNSSSGPHDTNSMDEAMIAGVDALPPLANVHDDPNLLSETGMADSVDLVMDLHGLPDMYVG